MEAVYLTSKKYRPFPQKCGVSLCFSSPFAKPFPKGSNTDFRVFALFFVWNFKIPSDIIDYMCYPFPPEVSAFEN
jgi:hypothetical protein